MKITSITAQARNANRVNVSVDGKYRFSLDIYQVAELGIRVGKDYSEQQLTELETESQFGKLYARALEYTMLRPHSGKEVRDYLFRKTRPRMNREGEKREGYSPALTSRVYDRLLEKGYIDDEKFARFWVENHHRAKGASLRRLAAELRAKGVAADVAGPVLAESDRTDSDELKKIIAKKRSRYPDEQKLMAYLARQGFSYDDIKAALMGDN